MSCAPFHSSNLPKFSVHGDTLDQILRLPIEKMSDTCYLQCLYDDIQRYDQRRIRCDCLCGGVPAKARRIKERVSDRLKKLMRMKWKEEQQKEKARNEC